MEHLTLQMDDLVDFNSEICGNLYFRIDHESFPEEDWFDRITANLEQWLPELVSFALGQRDLCRFEFMDESCYLKLSREEAQIFATGYRNGRKAFAKRQMDFHSFLTSVVDVIDGYSQYTQIRYFSKEKNLLLQCIDLGDKDV